MHRRRAPQANDRDKYAEFSRLNHELSKGITLRGMLRFKAAPSGVLSSFAVLCVRAVRARTRACGRAYLVHVCVCVCGLASQPLNRPTAEHVFCVCVRSQAPSLSTRSSQLPTSSSASSQVGLPVCVPAVCEACMQHVAGLQILLRVPVACS
jgi:hypothetical protein